jgi:cysteine-rich repeat protein
MNMKLKYLSRFAIVGLAAAFLYGPSLALAATSPTLTAAGSYSVLAGTTVTNTGPTIVHGDLGVSPGSAVTGFFPPGIVVDGTIHTADASAAAAQLDNTAAFLALSAGANAACTVTYAGIKDLVGLTLVPGVYCANAFTLSGTLTLNALGDANAVWIFRSASTLITASGVGASVQFLNGVGSPCNVWWKVGSSATIGVGTTFIGNILALTSIALETNASLNGRALAQTGAVTMDSNGVTACSSGGTQCGNGVINGSETCDLGGSNGVAGSGCSSSCAVEAGFTCTVVAPLTCTLIGPIPSVCGDSIISGSETCDAGLLNGVAGSGCSASCTVEAGFECSGQPSVCVSTACPDKFVGLGASGSCSVLETDGGKVSLSFGGPTGVGGDVCIPSGGSLSISGGQVVTGNIRLETGAHFQDSSHASVNLVSEGTNGLDPEIADCQNTSAAFAAKACSTTITTLTNQTITGICGENVYCVKDVIVGSHDTVTINAPAGCTTPATFIFNVTGKFVINGSATGGKIVAGVNVTPSQIFYNVIGPGPDVAFSGGGGGTGCCNASIDGSLIAEDRNVNLSPGKVNGVICSENDISIVSGSLVCPAAFP